MKKLSILFFAMCAIMMACTSEQGPDGSAERVEVSFNLDVDNLHSTRAISDGTGATQLMYGIFNEAGELIISKSVKNNITALLTDAGYTMSVSLVKGQSYKAVFWAQNPECDAYTVSEDMKVTVNYEGVNNDELRDAFYGATEIFTVKGSRTIAVEMKRPFAQINVGAFPFDLEHAAEQGVDIAKSQAIVMNVANQLDMFTGDVSGEVDVCYALNAIPEQNLVVDVDEDGTDEVYTYLSMSYVLAARETSTHEMLFVFTEIDGTNPIVLDEGLAVVPICRNWRTNIVGQLLTGDISFNLKIDPIYEGDKMNLGGLYYNFSEDVQIKDKYFAFNTDEAATFTSENNTLIALEKVTFSGRVEQIAFGEYREKGNYVSFTNTFDNVVAKDMVVSHPVGIANVESVDYMAPLIFLRGENTLNNCTFTGATSVAPDKTDYNGKTHKVIAYDCGVPNACGAVFNNCVVDKLYAWSHSRITLKNTKMKYIRCSTHPHSNPSAHLTIDAGSVVDEIFVTSTSLAKFQTIDGKKTLVAPKWSPSLIIKAGAVVKRLDMNNTPSIHEGKLTVIIEDGAVVQELVNAVDAIPNAPATK